MLTEEQLAGTSLPAGIRIAMTERIREGALSKERMLKKPSLFDQMIAEMLVRKYKTSTVE